MNPDVLQARVDEDREEVAHRIHHYNLGAIPIVDPRGHVVGIVTADDALEVLEEEGSEDALLLAGAGADSDAIEPLLSKVMHRAPMLVVTVAAGLLMSRLMNFFASKSGVEMSNFGGTVWADLVAYVPMVLALSGVGGGGADWQAGQTGRDWSSSWTQVMAFRVVKFTIDPASSAFSPSHTTIDGCAAKRRTLCRTSASSVLTISPR